MLKCCEALWPNRLEYKTKVKLIARWRSAPWLLQNLALINQMSIPKASEREIEDLSPIQPWHISQDLAEHVMWPEQVYASALNLMHPQSHPTSISQLPRMSAPIRYVDSSSNRAASATNRNWSVHDLGQLPETRPCSAQLAVQFWNDHVFGQNSATSFQRHVSFWTYVFFEQNQFLIRLHGGFQVAPHLVR